MSLTDLPDDDCWLSPAQERRYLGNPSKSTLYALKSDPTYPKPVLLGKRMPRVRLSELRAYVERRRLSSEEIQERAERAARTRRGANVA